MDQKQKELLIQIDNLNKEEKEQQEQQELQQNQFLKDLLLQVETTIKEKLHIMNNSVLNENKHQLKLKIQLLKQDNENVQTQINKLNHILTVDQFVQKYLKPYLQEPTLWPHKKEVLIDFYQFLLNKSTNSIFKLKLIISTKCLKVELQLQQLVESSPLKVSAIFTSLFCIFATILCFTPQQLQEVQSIKRCLILNLFLPDDDGEYYMPKIYLLDIKNYILSPSPSTSYVNHDHGNKFLYIKLSLQLQDNYQ